jgi:transcription initiation factor TFIIB
VVFERFSVITIIWSLASASVGEKMRTKCSECGSTGFVEDNTAGVLLCKECKCEVDDTIFDRRPDFADAEKGELKGHGPALKEHTKRFAAPTTISRKDLKNLPPKERFKFERLINWTNRTHTNLHRNIAQAEKVINDIASRLDISKGIIEDACTIYFDSVTRDLVRGRAATAVAAACVYIACRNFDLPRRLDEIAETVDISKKELGRTFRMLVRRLNLPVKPVDPVEYIPRLNAQLLLSPASETKAMELIAKIKKTDLMSGRSPASLAAAALYISGLLHGEKRTQREVADAAGITEVTVRNRYKEILIRFALRPKLLKAKKRRR